MTTTADVVVIVQARSSSSRLPGKVLKPFGDGTLLAHILKRLRLAGIPVWVATSTDPADDPVAKVGGEKADGVHRGQLDDVLGRFVGCLDALPTEPELVLRVCADRPFVDPELARALVEAYDEVGRPDYLANNFPKSYPDGLDLELIRTDVLRQADVEAVDSDEREHVTPFIYRRPDRFRLVNLPCPFGNFSDVRVVIDNIEDYDSLSRVCERLGDGGYRDLLTLATVQPSLFP